MNNNGLTYLFELSCVIHGIDNSKIDITIIYDYAKSKNISKQSDILQTSRSLHKTLYSDARTKMSTCFVAGHSFIVLLNLYVFLWQIKSVLSVQCVERNFHRQVSKIKDKVIVFFYDVLLPDFHNYCVTHSVNNNYLIFWK